MGAVPFIKRKINIFFIDSIADSIESVAEDEEQLADQLKEYLFYAEALQHLCANHEALQWALETAHEALNSRYFVFL